MGCQDKKSLLLNTLMASCGYVMGVGGSFDVITNKVKKGQDG